VCKLTQIAGLRWKPKHVQIHILNHSRYSPDHLLKFWKVTTWDNVVTFPSVVSSLVCIHSPVVTFHVTHTHMHMHMHTHTHMHMHTHMRTHTHTQTHIHTHAHTYTEQNHACRTPHLHCS
jgi:hypothetical protein